MHVKNCSFVVSFVIRCCRFCFPTLGFWTPAFVTRGLLSSGMGHPWNVARTLNVPPFLLPLVCSFRPWCFCRPLTFCVLSCLQFSQVQLPTPRELELSKWPKPVLFSWAFRAVWCACFLSYIVHPFIVMSAVRRRPLWRASGTQLWTPWRNQRLTGARVSEIKPWRSFLCM